MTSSSQKETYESNTPSASSSCTSVDGVFHHRSSKTIQSYQGFLSNSSVHTTTAVFHEDLFGVSEQDPDSSNIPFSLISDDKSLHYLEKRSFGTRNQSQSTVCTTGDEIESQANVGVVGRRAPQPPTAPQQQSATITSSAKTDKANDADIVKNLQGVCTEADSTSLHGPRIADDAVSPGSADGHDIIGSPTAINGPHPFQSHPAQSSTSASTNNSPNIAIPSSPSLSWKSFSSPPRTSTEVDFVGNSSPSAMAHRHNSLSATQRADRTSRAQSDSNKVLELGFDERVLRALCDLDVSVMPKSRLSPSQPPPSSSAECLCCSIESNRA